MKNLLFLAFLETKGEVCNYGDLEDLIVRHAGVEKVERAALRVAVRDLSKTLAKKKSFEIVRIGENTGKFRLGKYTTPTLKKTSPQVFTDIPPDHPLGAEKLVEYVIGRRRLPFHALYYLPSSAAWWISFSSVEATQRSETEAAAWEELQDRVITEAEENKEKILSVVGLAVGEGQGEIAILKKILDTLRKTGVRVHYLAVDFSPSLLRQHAENLKMVFKGEMAEGRLVCAAVLGNIFHLIEHDNERHPIDLSRTVVKEVSADFLPWNSPMVVTYLGNCLGNGPMQTEQEFFDIIRTRLGETLRTDQKGAAGTLQCLIGVSVKQDTEEPYGEQWNEFLLQGLRWLAKNGFILDGAFKVPNIKKDIVPYSVPYSASGILEGTRYLFKHKLGHTISAPPSATTSASRRQGYSVPEGQEIELYAVTKYDMKTLMNYVKQLGGLTTRNDSWTKKKIGPRLYGVFCVEVTRDDGSKKESE